MLMVMDVGNTHIVLGIYKGEELLYHWRVHTDRGSTEDEYGMRLKNLFSHVGIRMEEIEGLIICSVVPPLTYVLKLLAKKYFRVDPLVVGPGVKTGLNIQYENPREVGADRIVNAVAALDSYGPPVIVVDFGTATTFCFIDEKSRYVGGAITPGITVSTEALYERAAQLTRVEILRPDSVLGRNTVKSIQAGVYYGYVGMVDGIVSRMKRLMKQPPTVVATGGLAEMICQETRTIDHVDPLLTLRGLKLIYERNQR
ncbi:MAG: type III pantothenate kinase [Firmicutes bacterium]|uniref:Type III pantothenate kinase n=1 Tax=Melghirimyces thermohalophilus TaxID=1236220 RepID=A0A1G6Q2T2_9BACL|nr:type III pantothenate kinase [Melghirimyces thermohalophilus]MDA8352117.1 type III pantothenate kinase [Bacillota bacterium]SDC86618.1 type III pantothenate kinase [Melghirimyces thermohalophilus]